MYILRSYLVTYICARFHGSGQDSKMRARTKRDCQKKQSPKRGNFLQIQGKPPRIFYSALLRVRACVASILGRSGSLGPIRFKKVAKRLRFAPENFDIARFDRKTSRKKCQPSQLERSGRPLASQQGIFFREDLARNLVLQRCPA